MASPAPDAMNAPEHVRRTPQSQIGVPHPSTVPGMDHPGAIRPSPGTLVGSQVSEIVTQGRALTEPPRDPLSRPYRIPSGGLLNGGRDTVVIRPMRGEQQEVLAGAGDGPAAGAAIRHVVEQCVEAPFPHEEFEVQDWNAVLLHLFVLSAGTDEMPLQPTCPRAACGRQFNGTQRLKEMRCRVLRLAGPGEAATWPPSLEAHDEEQEILRDITGEDERGEQIYLVAGSLDEPFEVTLSDGTRIGWRYLRLVDQIQAEEYAERMASRDVRPGSNAFAFLTARMIVTINGERVGVLQAMQWVRAVPLFLSEEIQADVERRSFGYEMSPLFKCKHCGHSFRETLPLNGELFRRSRRTKHRRS